MWYKREGMNEINEASQRRKLWHAEIFQDINFIISNLSRLILLTNILKHLFYLLRQSQHCCISILAIINDSIMKINDFFHYPYDIINTNVLFTVALLEVAKRAWIWRRKKATRKDECSCQSNSWSAQNIWFWDDQQAILNKKPEFLKVRYHSLS